MFQITHCAISDISWKFHENPFIPFFHNAAIYQTECFAPGLLTAKEFSQWWNSLSHYYAVRVGHILKFNKNPLTVFYAMLLAGTGPENRKIDPGSKGLNTHKTPKYSRLFFVWYLNYSENFMKSIRPYFPVILLADTEFLEKKLLNIPVSERLNVIPTHCFRILCHFWPCLTMQCLY